MSSIIRATTTSGLQVAPDNSGSLQLQTNGTTTAVTIDTSQNVTTVGNTYLANSSGSVGINTATPNTKLDVNSGPAGYALTIQASGETSRKYQLGVLVGGALSFYDTAAAAERMRIDTSGNVLVGTTAQLTNSTSKLVATQSTSDYTARIGNSNAAPYGLYLSYDSATPNAASNRFIYCADSTAQRMYVYSNGGIGNYSANNVNLSDEREKKNIELAGSYLDKICAIPVKTFLYNDQTDTDPNLGVIAQDVQAVAPELVSESNWGTEEEPKERLSIYQTDLQYALMKCIQEQQIIINDLKARVETLEAK